MWIFYLNWCHFILIRWQLKRKLHLLRNLEKNLLSQKKLIEFFQPKQFRSDVFTFFWFRYRCFISVRISLKIKLKLFQLIYWAPHKFIRFTIHRKAFCPASWIRKGLNTFFESCQIHYSINKYFFNIALAGGVVYLALDH